MNLQGRGKEGLTEAQVQAIDDAVQQLENSEGVQVNKFSLSVKNHRIVWF